MLRRLPSFSLRTKLWLGLGGLFLILLLAIAISAAVLAHFSHELQRLLGENYDSAAYCDEMADALDRLDASTRQFAWDEAGLVENIAGQERRFEENLARQVDNVSLPGEMQLTGRLIDEWKTYALARQALREALPDERRRLYVKSLAPAYHDVRATAREISALNMHNVVSADGRVRKTALEIRNVLLLLAGAGALLASLVLAASGTRLLRPLRDLTLSVGRVGAGDLDLTVPVRSNDEVGQLAAAFNTMAERLRAYRKIDHDRLLRAQNTTQLAIDSLPDAVLVTSPEGLVEIANRTARTHFFADPGRNIAELGLDWLVNLHRRARTGMQVDPTGYASAVQLFQEGEEKFLLPHGVPMLDAGNVVGVAIILVDVTRLRQADEFKSSLVDTVSHELRTPLTSMRMSTIMLADETLGPLSSNQKKLAEAARDDSERLHRIIENLLNFSRAQAGSAKVRQRAVPVSSLINDALLPLTAGFMEKNIRVAVTTDGAPDAWADAPLAVSVLTNLLSNALKFTPAGGAVEVDAGPRGDMLAITISDNGPGIAAEHAGKIFQRFFRAPAPNAPPGTGLGLAIAREIAIAHGGSLKYIARQEGGSAFQFLLPTASAHVAFS